MFAGSVMENYRNDFEIYKNNRELVYLDYAATTFMPETVISSWVDYQQNVGVSFNRGDGALSEKAQYIFEDSKTEILHFFDAYNRYDMAFGKNATECLNLLANSVGKGLKPGDIILMSPYEHHSNILPWTYIAKNTGACLVQLPLSEDGGINYEFINSLDSKRIKVISMTMVSNINAYVIDINWIKKLVAGCSAFFILDVSQAVGHRKINFLEINADAYVMSAHKMYGPKNIGAAIIKKDILEELSPYILGGGMVWNSLGAEPKWHRGARKFEAGTLDVGLIKAWSEACKYLSGINMDNVMQTEKKIWKYLIKQIGDEKINIIPGGGACATICSFTIDGLHPHDIAELMAKNQIEIRTGHMCAQSTLNSFGVASICRISWGIGSSMNDIDRFLRILKGVL